MFTTLHANDAPSTITRLVDIGIPAYLVASSLNLVMAQRLVRKICSNCIEDYTPKESELIAAGISEEQAKEINFKVGKGCVHCDNTGYSGRTGIFEIIEVNSEVRKLIFAGENQDVIRDAAIKNGMHSLHASGIDKMKLGLTTISEVVKLTVSDE